MASELMKSFSANCKEYSENRSEETANSLQRSLQILGATSDSGVFDPVNRDTVDFFVNLYELMVNVDAQSNLIWSALGVLQEACHNPEARNALIHTYKFGPVLTRLLSVQFTSEKRLRILNLLQDLTYGIRISWQEAHLPQLISMLTKWITGDDAELIPVSVGILVNLCYKNLPAVYTLMRAVDIKKFLKIILKLQKNNDHLRVQICKLLIILECVSGGVPDSEINTYVRTTCPTLIEGLRNRNASLMRHVVDFYKEILDNAKVSHILTSYPSYLTDLGGIIEILQSEESTMNTDCLVIIFDFFICVIGLAKTDLEPLFPQLLNFTLRWVRTDGVSTTALNLLTTIITQLSTLHLQTNSNNTADSVFEILDKQLDVILLLLDTNNEIMDNNEDFNKMTALLQLLSEMIRVPTLYSKIIKFLSHSMVQNLFTPLFSPGTQGGKNMFQPSVYSFYVQALCFLMELANKETNWLLLFSELVLEKQIILLLAIALYTGSEPIKKKVLFLTGTTGFSAESLGSLAKSMAELNKLVIFSPSGNNVQELNVLNTSHLSPMDITPLLSITQEGHLNSILDKFERIANENENSMTSAMMEMFQYKMASMSHTLRHMQSSQQAADERSTKLQHSLALTSAEVSRLHQLLHSAQQSLEGKSKELKNINSQLAHTQQQAKETHDKYAQLLQNTKSKTIIINEQNQQLEALNLSIKEKQLEINELQSKLSATEEELTQKVQYLQKIETNLKEIQEKNSEMEKGITNLESSLEAAKRAGVEYKKDIDCKNHKIEDLKKEIVSQSTVIRRLEKVIGEKEQLLAQQTEELKEQRRLREIVSELMTGKRKLEK